MRRYELSLDFATGSLDYRGRVTFIDDDLGPRLSLDSEVSKILSAHSGGRPLPFVQDEAEGVLRISEIPSGTRGVSVEFTGRAEAERSFGIYRSPLGDGSLLTTDLEPAGARKVFPCIDRPDVKAAIQLEVTAPADAVVISNMPPERTELIPDGRRRTRFFATPPMATYLFYLGVGPFEEREEVHQGIQVIGASARGSSGRTAYLLGEIGRLLDFYTKYYGLPYPLPKVHLLAIPRLLGGMENWGAITCSEPYVLVDERTSVHARKQLFTIQAHEVAHQWFGNLVTLRTWDDLWLNEGFATFASYGARHSLHPEWTAWEEFLTDHVGDAMVYDSLRATHPVRLAVTDVRRALEIFDEISYGKGSAVLRMLEDFVGEEAFRAGVSLYLREHQWGSAEAADLWRAIARTSREPIDRVMPPWILRPGYPVVRARLDGDALVLEQLRFGLSGSTEEPPWPIPLSLAVQGETRHLLMEERTLRVSVPSGARVLVEPGRAGFFRTRYEGELWGRVLNSYPSLGPADRWGMMDDARAFLLSGEMGLDEYLGMLTTAARDEHPLVVHQACDALNWLTPLTIEVPRLRDAFRDLLVNQSERLGLTARRDETPGDTALRERVTQSRVGLDPEFARALAARYSALDREEPEVVEAVCMAYARGAGSEEYNALRRRFREARSPSTMMAFAGAMGCLPRDDWILECLGMVSSGEMQHVPWIHMASAILWRNPAHYSAVWTFLTERLEAALPALSSGGALTSALLQWAIPAIGLGRPVEMRRWLADHPLPDTDVGRRKGLEVLEALQSVLERSGRSAPAPGARAG